ncbi:MAG: ADP-ribosylglycohydrolase family protein, partial [Nitrospinaceae bacterium]
SRRPDPGAFADLLGRMSAGGAEPYFGVFRRPEACFVRTVQQLPDRADILYADLATAYGSYFPLGVTLSLFYGRDSATLQKACLDTAGIMSRHPWETTGAVVAALVTLQLMQAPPPGGGAGLAEAPGLLEAAAAGARRAEDVWQEMRPGEEGAPPPHALSDALSGLRERWDRLGMEALAAWICENANRSLKTPVHHAAQGQTLTLLPLALVLVLKQGGGYGAALARLAAHGREADKLGALGGAWAGALYGAEGIPQALRSGLVNGREIKLRGEALMRRRTAKGKDLIPMEMGLTQKEAEEKRRYLPLETKKKTGPKKAAAGFWAEVEEEPDPLVEIREDPRRWRQFEREKSRKKKDRRKKPAAPDDF